VHQKLLLALFSLQGLILERAKPRVEGRQEDRRALQPWRRHILAFSHQRLSEPSPGDAEVPQSMESRIGDPLDQKEGQFCQICLEQVNSYDFLPLYWVARHATLSPNSL
jgi:hypothetical protein